jgi:hypothetical protein
MTTEASDLRWKRLVGEGAAIVASILLAFWIDAAWEQRQESARLQQTLVAIRGDLEASKNSVAFYLSIASARRDSVLALYEATNQESPQLGGKELDQLLTVLEFAPDGATIGTAGIQALIFSGGLASIENDALRAELADWPRRVSVLQAKELQDTRGYFELWMPYAKRNGEIGQVQNLITRFPGIPGSVLEPFPIAPRESFDHSGMLRDREFRNILVATWVTMVDLIDRYENAENWLNESIALIDAELDGG